ncbi:MAG: HEPN domain-containing protein [Bacteroidota bacterium]
MSGVLDLKNVSDLAAKDIIELQNKIEAMKNGTMDGERFRHYRLTRGVYGQRQKDVQMFRTKIPFGKLTAAQLTRLADVSEKYTNGNLHLTTRQNVQMHYIKLEDSPGVWTELSEVGVTAREACGNTVRNITASAIAGIDPKELFDVSPYVQATYEYFLRNAICQDMGRKIKPAFSSSDEDSAYTYFHDFGFIPRINEAGERGFKVVVAGGLGAQSIVAQTAYEFLHEDQIIPFMEAGIRVFDRHGEREKRHKARMKYLVKKLGLEGFMELVEAEMKALPYQTYKIDRTLVSEGTPVAADKKAPVDYVYNEQKYADFLKANVFEQKQKGFYGVNLRVHRGDISAERARRLATLVKEYAADDIRVTVNQGFGLRFVRKEHLPHLFNQLDALELGEPGFDTIMDITACPGTDTCALGVTNSTDITTVLEKMLRTEYPHLIEERNIKIKISGCMNSCGQHMAANIGLHGSSIKRGTLVYPAMQIVMGGGVDPTGKGFVADRVIKTPTKKIPDVLRTILDDYEANGGEFQYFNDYYQQQGKKYFYGLLKDLAKVDELGPEYLQDWGQATNYVQDIGVGECAGVSLDLVSTIVNDAKERLEKAKEDFDKDNYAFSIYNSYTSLIIGAKALLLSADVKCNTHSGIIKDFDTHYIATGNFQLEDFDTFADLVYQIQGNEPKSDFAANYLAQADAFFNKVVATRQQQVLVGAVDEEKLVVDQFYKA